MNNEARRIEEERDAYWTENYPGMHPDCPACGAEICTEPAGEKLCHGDVAPGVEVAGDELCGDCASPRSRILRALVDACWLLRRGLVERAEERHGWAFGLFIMARMEGSEHLRRRLMLVRLFVDRAMAARRAA